MPNSVLTRGRSLVARLTALAMVASIMVVGALPASAAVATSDACPAPPSAGFVDIAAYPAATQLAINCLADYEIAQGTSATTYSPQMDVSRWQMALFLTRQAEVHGFTLPSGAAQGFTDIGAYPASTQTAINQLAQLGITTGTTATTYSPAAPVTRWQMALFLTRLLDAADYPLGSGADQGFTDISAYPASTQTAINQLVQAGVADGFSATMYGPDQVTLRSQMALFLTRVLQVGGVTPPGTIGPNMTFTAAPELESVVRDTANANVVRFHYDTAIPGKAAELDDFRLYRPNGTFETAIEVSISGSTVLARFPAGWSATAVRAGARTGAVETGTGIPSIAGGFALTASAAQTPPINPNLISVGNYRFADDLSDGTNLVLVDFVFSTTAVTHDLLEDIVHEVWDDGVLDEAFHLIGNNGQRWDALTGPEPQAAAYDSTNGRTTVTVAFAVDPTDVPQTQLRRGVFIDYPSANNPSGSYVLWAADFAGTNGITVDPDLVSVTREGATSWYRFVFDEAVDDEEIDETQFYLVASDLSWTEGTFATRVADAAASTVRVFFGDMGMDLSGPAVHAEVWEGAVLATDSTDSDFDGFNRADSAGITVPLVADPTPGKTAAWDIVSAQRFQNIVTGRFSIAVTFDQAVTLVDVGLMSVTLYDAAGVAFVANVAGATVSGSTVTYTSLATNLTDDQIEATVTVSVQTTIAATDPAIATEGQVDARALAQS